MIIWSVYWILITAAYLILSISFGNWILYCPIPIAGALYFAVRLLLNNPFRRFACVRGRHPAYIAAELAVIIAIVSAVQALGGTGYSMNTEFLDSFDYSVFGKNDPASVTYDTQSGVYTLTASNYEFRILQLTDIHIGESITTLRTDRKAFTACYDLIKEAMPDLIVVTGDIAYAIPTMTFSSNNLSAIGTFASFMDRVGIPWIMTYGNHDNEPMSQYRDEKSFEGLFRHYQATGESAMLYSDIQPEIYGRYNQYIRICNSDGNLNRIIFLIDSNDYVKGVYEVNKYDSVHEDQLRWYSETTDAVNHEQGRTVPSFVFMHIPFRAFADAQNALEQNSDDAVYLFGTNEEKVSYPDSDSGFFDLILEKKSTQAVFVGHDHVNNMAVRYRGVDLVYSKSIDYIAYPKIESKTDQRGATLITLSQDGSYKIEQISYKK